MYTVVKGGAREPKAPPPPLDTPLLLLVSQFTVYAPLITWVRTQHSIFFFFFFYNATKIHTTQMQHTKKYI